MKLHKLISGVVMIALVASSCQKEIDWGVPGTNTIEKLIRIKSKTGTTDSTQVDYLYDGSGRLVREITTGIGAGTDLGNDLVIKRNGSGVITSTVQKSAVLVTAGIDSIETIFNYNTATSRYSSSVFLLGIPGLTVKDSAVYTYDGSGRIAKDEHYLKLTGIPIPIPAVLSARNTYTYSADGKNLLSISTEAAIPPATTLAPVSLQTFMMDTKVNPLIILNEAILTGRTGFYSANNATKTALANTVDPTQNFTMDYIYKYNTKNKPDSSTGTRTPGGAVAVSKYFYQ